MNGIPLVFIELKASHKSLENAYKHNLSDYKTTIPQLFWYNAFIILSNGSKSKIGSITAGWEHFAEWKKINDEGEEGVVSLETIVRGVCDKTRLLDLVENFTIFSEAKGETAKLVAKNHQFLGVNRALHAVQEMKTEPRQESASSGTRRVRARASRWCSSRRKSCGSFTATGRFSSSPTAKTSTARSTRISHRQVR